MVYSDMTLTSNTVAVSALSQKIMRCRIFAITSSTVNCFWKFFHCWKQQ